MMTKRFYVCVTLTRFIAFDGHQRQACPISMQDVLTSAGRLATRKFQLKAKILKAWESFSCLIVISSFLLVRLFTKPKT
jgi:hypothetical protein